MKASILTIGDEILIGQIIDTNSAWMGEYLNTFGIDVHAIYSVQDTLPSIIEGLNTATQNSELVLITGGLGPTKDDLTCEALAAYFNVELEFQHELWERIQGLFRDRGREPTDLHKQQCFLPANATLLPNKMGTAPGMLFEQNGKKFISMPGVPYEMKYIMMTHVSPMLQEATPVYIYHKTILTAGKGESFISKQIQDIEESLPEHIKLAYLPNLSRVRVRLSSKTSSFSVDQNAEVDQFVHSITERLGSLVYGYDEVPFEKVLGQLCLEKGLRIASAESCTGGLIANQLVSVPGSSAYYTGSIVAYSYELKNSLLGVSQDLLDAKGAVSEEVVLAMLEGLFDQTNADVGIAVSGIAGPGGGTVTKPVGTVWIAVGNKDKQHTEKILIGKDRDINIRYSANYALNMLRLFILEMYN
jgi:nicotinamide-nucleotide amidase